MDLLVYVVVCLLFYVASAYRVGDPVDTVIYHKSETSIAVRSQVPLFGVTKQVGFSQLENEFSLGFDQGLWAIPWIEIKRANGKMLQKLQISFVYSRSSGIIHSVSKKAIYENRRGERPPSIVPVEYIWEEEEPVSLVGGSIVMFLATLIASVYFLLQACGLSEDDEDDGSSPSRPVGHTRPGSIELSTGIPKFE